ncbi:helix-turn-helix domain-containing protein [Streptomyces sp. NPDC059863]|uniref:helix-turn-helix domain-containing protein n=1 Tax=unclassified Streptomyces TaxID=2593676 RepID=UPI003647DF5D
MTDEPTPERAAPPAAKPTRRLDARSLRGLAHPLRMSIYEVLRLDGPATATLLSERLGENTGTISWHLRHLAEHGFIEEETGRGTKRERWWRTVNVTNVLNTADFRDDPDARGAVSVFTHELLRQHFDRVTHYLGEEWEDEWRNAGTISDWRDLRMTPDQLRALNEELTAVIARHLPAPGADTDTDTESAPDALPIVVQLQSFPRREHGGSP